MCDLTAGGGFPFCYRAGRHFSADKKVFLHYSTFSPFLQPCTAGALRLTADRAQNAEIISAWRTGTEPDEALADRLQKLFAGSRMDAAAVVRKYTRIRKNAHGKLDKAAAVQLSDKLERFVRMTEESSDNREAGEPSITDASQIPLKKGNAVTGVAVLYFAAKKFCNPPLTNWSVYDRLSVEVY